MASKVLRSLRTRLTLAVVLVTVVASGVVGLLIGHVTKHEFDSYLELEVEGPVSSDVDLAALLEHYGARGGWDDVGPVLRDLAGSGGADLLLFDPERRLVADSRFGASGDALLREDGTLELTRRAEIDGAVAEEAVAVRSGLPLRSEGRPVGTLFVVPAPDRERPAPGTGFLRSVNRWKYVGIGLAALIAAAIALALSSRIVGPLERLTDAARRMEAGELGQRVSIESEDEVGELGRAFNAMAEALERNEQARRRMVGDVAHELRTPLTTLRCRIEALQDGLLRPEPALLAELQREVVHLGRLVDDLQELALAEAGELRLYPVDLEPGELIREVAEALTAEGGRTIYLPAGPLPRVRVDPDRLRQVVRNLLHNALQHVDEGGTVAVDAAPRLAVLLVTVRNSGAGIAPEHLPHVFERFYRTDPSRDRRTGGAGLGLAIVAELVSAWGGETGAESHPGQGASFWFTVPLA